MADDLVFDAWTPLSFKRALGSKKQPGVSWVAPTWVGDHARRLQAYKVLQSYIDNAARVHLITDSETERDSHREYGDAALLVMTILSSLIGRDQTITVDGSDDYNENLGEDATPEDVTANEEAAQARELEEWLRKWADSERLPHKLIETERNAIGLGDGVYTLGWSPAKKRPRLRVFDPGFYFPVLDDGNEDEYPSKVHIAWEVDSDDGKVHIRRITWELGAIEPVLDDREGVIETRREWVPREGDEVTEDGEIQRTYPWNEEPSGITCYLTDATYIIDQGHPRSIEELSEDRAVYTEDDEGEIRRRDLMIDFIPVVHVPNTIAIANHYGTSSLARVAQILDDLANADTDLQAASATTGTPPIALSGGTLGDQRLTYRPGELLETGDGTMTMLDTSKSLDALMKYAEGLMKRLSVNSRLPASVLGRVEPSEVPSGIALLLSFGPLSAMIDEMRLVRDEKNSLVLKFVHRLALAGGAEEAPPEWSQSNILYGPYLPEDRGGAIREVTELLNAKAISLETAVRMLISAGFPIEDAIEEVKRIESRDFEGAARLADAIADEAAAADYLGRERVERPLPPGDIVELPELPEGEET